MNIIFKSMQDKSEPNTYSKWKALELRKGIVKLG